MVIAGPQSEPPTRNDPFRVILSPFDRTALVLVIVLPIMFLILWFITFLATKRPICLRNIARHALGEHALVLARKGPGERREFVNVSVDHEN